ncbi:unnamed protein product [Rotaria magnacalcarata]|uniref:F-box domain-containing protein n=2 Tax=Rotaria magnacalcarata TaxID=392030 RepID=A0A816PY13_9BILA|nr:unnamed protein product [Rotaria magnacalcarata]
MVLLLEILPTEILFCIFDYLTVFDILRGFINLNKRINDIVGLYPFVLDFQEISRSKLDFICRHIQPKQILSIYLSDEFMPDQVKIFNLHFPDFHEQFFGLKKMKFINTSTVLPNLPVTLTCLSIKTYLKTNSTDNFITKILRQQAQYLTFLKVDGSYVFRSIDTAFPSLKHLTIDYCTITEFHRILFCFQSSLTELKLFLDREENLPRINFKQLSNTLIDLSISFSEDIIMSFALVKDFIEDLAKLKYFTIQATGTLDLMNGELWEEYLFQKNIKKFNFKFTLSNSFLLDYDENLLLKPFRSSFWLKQQQWYVACEKRTLKSSCSTIYSIPYFQPKLIFYPSNNFQPVTTADREVVSKHANNLILTFHKTIQLPSSFFCHIYSLTLLTLTLPPIEILQSIVDLKQIREIDVSLVKNLSIGEFEIFIECMTNLKAIKMEYNPLFVPPIRINCYTFIRKDEELFIIDENNIKRFCYLFFHVRNLEITVQSKDIIIQLLARLYYLERIKIFCYQNSLLNIKYNWFKQNIPRFNTVTFTYRITTTCLSLSIGNEKPIDDETPVKNTTCKILACGLHKYRSGCQIQ